MSLERPRALASYCAPSRQRPHRCRSLSILVCACGLKRLDLGPCIHDLCPLVCGARHVYCAAELGQRLFRALQCHVDLAQMILHHVLQTLL